jgi:FkbM family methyltransferase
MATNNTYYPTQKKYITLGGYVASLRGIADDDIYYSSIINNIEPEFYEIVKVCIPNDGICIDIGANIGVKTFIMARHASKGKILSIEAGQWVSKVLIMNIKENNLYNVTVEHAVITEQSGEIIFSECSAWGHITTSLESREGGAKVPAYTLNDLFMKHKLERVDFIKIDTEGHELSVLRSGLARIEKMQPWIFFEFNSLCLMAYGDINPKELLIFVFANFKYVFRVMKNGPPWLKPVEASDIITLLYKNIIKNSSIDDFLCTNRQSALDEVKDLIITSNSNLDKEEYNRIISENKNEINRIYEELEAMRHSKSWKITTPLRWISRKVKFK